MRLTTYDVQLWDIRWNPDRDIHFPHLMAFTVRAFNASEALTFAIDRATEAVGATIASSDPLVIDLDTGDHVIGG